MSLIKLQLSAESIRRTGALTQLTAVAELLQLWVSAIAVSGELLATARTGALTQLTAVADLLQLWVSAITVSGKLLATAGSAVTAAGQSHVGGPHAASHELGGSPPYGPWTWHCVLACNPRHRCALLMALGLGIVCWHAT